MNKISTVIQLLCTFPPALVSQQSSNTIPIDYPKLVFEADLFFTQPRLEQNDHLGSTYQTKLVFNLKDFDKYDLELFEYQISFKLIEQNTLLNNQMVTYNENIEFAWTSAHFVNFDLPPRVYTTQHQTPITVKPLISFNVTEQNQFIELTHRNLYQTKWRNMQVFTKRTIQIAEIVLRLKPKMDYQFWDNIELEIMINPINIKKQLSDINLQIINFIEQTLDMYHIDRRVFNYFYANDGLSEDEILLLTNVNNHFNQRFDKRIELKSKIKADKVLNTIPPIHFRLIVKQLINIDQLGLPSIVIINEALTDFNADKLFNAIFNGDYAIWNFIKIQQTDIDKYLISSSLENIQGTKEVNIKVNTKSPDLIIIRNDPEIPSPSPNDDLTEETGDVVKPINTKQQFKYKMIVMFVLALLFIILGVVGFWVKDKIFKSKND